MDDILMVKKLKAAVDDLAALMTEALALGLEVDFSIRKVEPPPGRGFRKVEPTFEPVVFKVSKDLTKDLEK
jgi:hypothetical protein